MSSLAHEWNTLCSDCPESDIFQSAEYILSWWAVFGRSYDLRVYSVRDASKRLIGLLPAYLIRIRKFAQSDYYELRFLGSEEHQESGYFDLIARPRDRARVTGVIVPVMLGEGTDWRSVNLRGVPADSPFARRLMKNLGVDEMSCTRRTHNIIELPPSWSLYLNTLEPGQREQLRMGSERLGFKAKTAISKHESKDSILGWVDKYIQLGRDLGHKSGSEKQRTFLDRLCRDLVRGGRVRAYSSVLDKDQFGVLMAFDWEGTTYLGTARTNSTELKNEVERALYVEAIQDAISAGTDRCDFLASTPLSQMLAPQTRETIDLVAERPDTQARGFATRLRLLLRG